MLALELLVFEDFLRLIAAHDFAHKGLVAVDNLFHLGFNRFEVIGGNRLIETEVIEKTVFCFTQI